MSEHPVATEARSEVAAAHFVVSELSTIEQVDEAACALLGYGKHELIGLHGSEIVPPDYQPATAVSVDRMRRGELTQRIGRLQR
jgi:PAS domain S-box-containing protein